MKLMLLEESCLVNERSIFYPYCNPSRLAYTESTKIEPQFAWFKPACSSQHAGFFLWPKFVHGCLLEALHPPSTLISAG